MFIFKIHSPNTYKLLNIINNNISGYCVFRIANDNTYINNIQVKKEFRNNNIGSLLLKQVETFSEFNEILSIRTTVHKQCLSSLEEFYIKNNFKILYTSNKYYDDGENIFETINMIKHL